MAPGIASTAANMDNILVHVGKYQTRSSEGLFVYPGVNLEGDQRLCVSVLSINKEKTYRCENKERAWAAT